VADAAGEFAGIDAQGLCVSDERGTQIASLRYFEPADRFAAAVGEGVGCPMPGPLRTMRTEGAGGAQFILAWRSPTETLLLSGDPAAFASLGRRLAQEDGGCMVDQTGGLRVLHLRGAKAKELLLRLGSTASVPPLGEARSSRVAELQVLTLCVDADEYVLVVERVYAAHLGRWMQVTAADFQ